jgi:Asp-tRNA(Asn)/Glu-tRNA(Gln) amidotransferase A subunit family amidase
MTQSPDPFAASPLRQLSLRIAADDAALEDVIHEAVAQANGNAGRNTYVRLQDAVEYARHLPRRYPDLADRPLLYGLPFSVKDCFDIAGAVTTLGSRYYAEVNPPASTDSWVVQRLCAAGAVIIGKTHMQELAYGITGENAWLSDCLQPRDSSLLTGGSSSGAAASVQEASAVAAIGTDTGGSIRVPAALCDLVGFRASHGVGEWHGGWHLAPSFDTIGCIFRDLRDGPLLGSALFGFRGASPPRAARIGVPSAQFLADCESAVADRVQHWREALAARGHSLDEFDADFWQQSFATFSAIQAHEAANQHRGLYGCFESSIRDRLEWGAGMSDTALAGFRAEQAVFQEHMDELLRRFDFLLLPIIPMERLVAGVDHSQARSSIMRYTAPISLAGLPVVALPGGMQLIGARGSDAQLLAFASALR